MTRDTLKYKLVEAGLDRVAESIASHARVCATYNSGEKDATSNSKLGGKPLLPPEFEWPRREKPITFLGQFELDEVASGLDDIPLPTTGLLSYFYDYENMPWGYDPKDKGGGQLFYFSDVALLEERVPPEEIELDDAFRDVRLLPKLGLSLPDPWSPEIRALQLTESEVNAYVSIFPEGVPRHQVGGLPAIIQNPMEIQCQLVTNDVYCGNSTHFNDPRAKVLAADAADWILLLQIDSDDDADMMWGDCGRLYVWIRRQDLAARRFDKTWTILQCY
jgi:uncharacterized protein YwqG